MPDNNLNLAKNLLTLEYLEGEFQKLYNATPFHLSHYVYGPVEDVDITKLNQNQYPLLYVEASNTTVNNFIQTFSFEVAILDKFATNEKKTGYPLDYHATLKQMRVSCISRTNETMKWLISAFVQNLISSSFINSDVDLQMPIDLSPVSSEYDNSLFGWTGTFVITANNKNDWCSNPIIGQG